jgi:hypothetical protein
MSGLEWILVVVLGVLYIALLCTVALLTFRKGYVVLGILGFLFPILWLIGAVLPTPKSSAFDVEHYQRDQAIASGARGGAL